MRVRRCLQQTTTGYEQSDPLPNWRQLAGRPASTKLALQMAKRAGFDTGATLIRRPTGFSMQSQLENTTDARVKFSLRWPRGR